MATISEYYVKYCDKFKKIFSISENGSIKVDNETLIELKDWILDEDTKILFSTLLNVEIQESDLPHTVNNSYDKHKLWSLYRSCYLAYLKASYLSKIQFDLKYKNVKEDNIYLI